MTVNFDRITLERGEKGVEARDVAEVCPIHDAEFVWDREACLAYCVECAVEEATEVWESEAAGVTAANLLAQQPDRGFATIDEMAAWMGEA